MIEPYFLNTVRDHNRYIKMYFMPLGGIKELFFVFCLILSWRTSILCLCMVGELARGGSVAVTVSIGDRGKVTCDM